MKTKRTAKEKANFIKSYTESKHSANAVINSSETFDSDIRISAEIKLWTAVLKKAVMDLDTIINRINTTTEKSNINYMLLLRYLDDLDTLAAQINTDYFSDICSMIGFHTSKIIKYIELFKIKLYKKLDHAELLKTKLKRKEMSKFKNINLDMYFLKSNGKYTLN